MTPPILAAAFCSACHAKFEVGPPARDKPSDALFFPARKITKEEARDEFACPRCGAKVAVRIEPDEAGGS